MVTCLQLAALCLLVLAPQCCAQSQLQATADPDDISSGILLHDPEHEQLLQEFLSRSSGSLERQLLDQLPGSLAPVPSAALPPGGVLPTGPEEKIPADGQSYLVPNTTVYPFSAIGYVLFQTSQYDGLCSGSLIAPNVVLSAAHCVYDTSSGVEPLDGVFIPAYNPASDNPTPFGTSNITAIKFPSAFADCPLGNYSSCFALNDVALLYLDQSFDDSHVLKFGFDNALVGNETLYTAGYPGDRCANDSLTCFMWATGCPMSLYNDSLAADPGIDGCMSAEGQSGSPIWLDDPSSGQPLVIGILTFGPGGSGSSQTSASSDDYDFTGYTVISADLLQELQSWIADGPDTNDPQQTGALLDQIA